MGPSEWARRGQGFPIQQRRDEKLSIDPGGNLCFPGLLTSIACAEGEPNPSCELRHPMTDAWFTGPMLANTAATAARGHYLIEPYLYDIITQGSYGANGARHSSPHENSFGSLTYLIYGLTNRIGIGLIPTAGYSMLSGALSSSGPEPGDLTLQIQRRFAQFQPCGRVPTISLECRKPSRPGNTTVWETARQTDSAPALTRPIRSFSRRCISGSPIGVSCGCASMDPTRFQAKSALRMRAFMERPQDFAAARNQAALFIWT
jgi:hypothetical protein